MQTETTVDSCFMLPVQQQKLGSFRDFWDDANEKYSMDFDGHFKLNGVQKAMVFLQSMPDEREYMVMYLRSKEGFEKTFRGIFSSDLKCSKYLAARFADFTGIDLSRPENVPELERLIDWTEKREFLEERQMLQMPWCYAAPILPGKTEDLLKYSKEAASRRGEWEKLLRDHDVVRNLSCLQHTKQGDFIVKYVLASNTMEYLLKAFLACSHEMCSMAWNMSRELTGIDFSDPKNLPDVKLLFKWDEIMGFETADQLIAYTE